MKSILLKTEYETKNKQDPSVPEEQIEVLKEQNKVLEEKNKVLEEQHAVDQQIILNLKEQVRILSLRRFAPSSEKMLVPDGQQVFEGYFDNVFNEAEATADPSIPEPEAVVGEHTRKIKGKRKQDFSGLTVNEEIIDLPEDQKTPNLILIGRKTIEERLNYTPSSISLTRIMALVYKDSEKSDDEHTVIVQPETPTPLFTKSIASASLVAGIIDQKFTLGLPLYRQQQDFERKGLGFINRQNMSNWVINASKDYLSLLYNYLYKQLLREDIINADETTVQVLNEPGRLATSKSYMWLYRTGAHSSKPIILFEYQPSRSAQNPKIFLDGYSGYLSTDGYEAYHSLGVTNVGCWGHCRRYFFDAYKAIPKNVRDGSASKIALDYCNQLLKLEQSFNSLTPEKRYKERLEKSKPLAEKFFEWVEKSFVLPKSLLGIALTYAKNQKEYLMNVYLDGRLEFTNNLSERSIKPFVIGRKGWLFSNSVDGANASATIYSIVETAKANELVPYEYIKFLLERLPSLTTKNIPDLLPWSETIPNVCRKYKK